MNETSATIAGPIRTLAPERLIDIRYDDFKLAQVGSSRWEAALGVAAIILVPLVVAFAVPLGPRKWFIVAGYAIVICTLTAYFGRRLWRWTRSADDLRQIDQLMRTLQPNSVGQAARDSLWIGRGDMHRTVERIVRAIVSIGCAPYVIRICSHKRATTVRPIAVPFDPRPIDEADETFRAIENADHDAPSIPDGSAGPFRDTERIRFARHMWRRMKRNMILAGGISIMLIGGCQLASSTVRWFSRPFYDWWLLALNFGLPLLLLIVPMLVPRGIRFASRREWYLVPAGVVVRTVRWSGRHWQLALYRQDDSVLVVYPLARGEWSAAIGNHAGFDRTLATAREVECLLRAWLCPLEPPSLDKLSDLQ